MSVAAVFDLVRAIFALAGFTLLAVRGPRGIGIEPTVMILAASLGYAIDMGCAVARIDASSTLARVRDHLHLVGPIAWCALVYGLRVAQERAAAGRAHDGLVKLTHELDARVAEGVAEARAATQELEGLLRSISHDLRAPLRAISGFVGAAREDARDLGPEAEDYLARVEAAAARMGLLVEELSRLSRLSIRPLERLPLDVSALALSVGRDLRAAHPEQRVELRVTPGLRASGDPLLVRTVLENLIGNAWKFSSPRADARVWVGEATVCGVRAFYVRDEGVGFDPSLARELFTPFRRLHGDEFPGTGVGLASVLRAVRRHGGSVWAEGAPGAGATFWFTLAPGAVPRAGPADMP